MNILFYFISQINPQCGGTERVADNVAHGLKARGHNVYYMSRTKVPGKYDIPCFFLPNAKGITQANIEFVNFFCKEYKIDAIVNEAGNTDDVRLFSKEYIHGTKIVTELHFCPMQSLRYFYRSLNLPISIKNPINSFINVCKWVKAPYNRYITLKNIRQNYRYMYDNSDRVVVLSPSYIDDFANIAGLSGKSRLTAIYNPCTFIASENKLPKEKIILSIGRLQFAPKRIDYLLDIWKTVYPIHRDWKLIICGDGEYRSALELYVKRKKIKGVLFVGNVSPQTYYERASLMCMTSLNEGTPMVVIEAMQCACVPVVYNTYAAVDDLISDGKTGIIIEPFNKSEYSSKLSSLMGNFHELEKIGRFAQESTSRFNINGILDQWESLLSFQSE